MIKSPSLQAVLFDLDGTLVDTAPDLVAALNLALREHGFSEVSLSSMRHAASHGSMALVRAANPDLGEVEALMLQQALLKHYASVNGEHAKLFDGVPALLEYLAAQQIPWGIVTNKAARYARPLIAKLGLDKGVWRCHSVISGDTVTRGKPDPAPLLLAVSQMSSCKDMDNRNASLFYLGDARRDMESARAAGMVSVLAAWGYISESDDVGSWPVDMTLNSPCDLISLIRPI